MSAFIKAVHPIYEQGIRTIGKKTGTKIKFHAITSQTTAKTEKVSKKVEVLQILSRECTRITFR